MKLDRPKVLINPAFPQDKRNRILCGLHGMLSDHFWLGTSGSSGVEKWVALSRDAIFASAEVVNQHLSSTSQDTWLHLLPDFHVGGLGIWARAELSGAQVLKIEEKWNPKILAETKATLTSLVPTQIYDLVQQQLKPPCSLRAILVGGGALSDQLYQQARELGWPLLCTYGMTETASQVATSSLDNKKLQVLPHLDVRIRNDRINIRGKSLFTCYAKIAEDWLSLEDPKQDGWFESDDLGSYENNILSIHGRVDDRVKILGENVNLLHLNHILSEIKTFDCEIIGIPDERTDHAICLLTTSPNSEACIQEFNRRVLPFERITHIQVVEEIERTTLGKARRNSQQSSDAKQIDM